MFWGLTFFSVPSVTSGKKMTEAKKDGAPVRSEKWLPADAAHDAGPSLSGRRRSQPAIPLATIAFGLKMDLPLPALPAKAQSLTRAKCPLPCVRRIRVHNLEPCHCLP